MREIKVRLRSINEKQQLKLYVFYLFYKEISFVEEEKICTVKRKKKQKPSFTVIVYDRWALLL